VEPTFVEFADSHDDVVAISFNAWWPYNQDPLYQHNTADNTGRILYYQIPGVPHEIVDGVEAISGPHSEAHFQAAYDLRKATPTSVSLEIEGLYNESTRELDCTVTATTDQVLTPGDYRLHLVLTESDIFFDGSNGIQWHQYVMRDMLPDFEGSPVSFSGDLPQSDQSMLNTTIDALYEQGNCRLTYFLQDNTTKEVFQAGSIALMDLLEPVDVIEVPSYSRLGAVYPNPFNPKTTIPLELDRAGYLKLDIVDASGRLVSTLHDGNLPAGRTEFNWNAVDHRGNSLGSGVYLARIRDEYGSTRSSRMLLLK
jgi:hypothetical protein